MSTAIAQHTRRRSSRLQVKIPVLLSSLDPQIQYSEVCEALIVNAHGCGVRSPKPLDAGIPVQLRMKGGAQTNARIVSTQFIASDRGVWMLGISLDKPGNFWGVTPCPQDWLRPSDHHPQETSKLLQPLASPVSGDPHHWRTRVSSTILKPASEHPDPSCRVENRGNSARQATSSAPQVGSAVATQVDSAERQPVATSESMSQQNDRLGALAAQLIQPLRTELEAMRRQFTEAEQKRQALGLALAQIPSDLEERLWNHLRSSLEAEIAKKTEPVQTHVAQLKTQLESILPGQDVTNSLRELSARIDAINVDLHATVQEQTAAARWQAEELSEKVTTVEQLAITNAEQLAGVPDLVTSKNVELQDSLVAVTRDYVKDIEALQQFRSETEATLQQTVQVQAAFGALAEHVAQVRGEHLSALQERLERQIREQSEQTLSAAKILINEQRTDSAENARMAAKILEKTESAAESLKERFHKTVTDAQQQTLAVFEHHINYTHDNVRKQVAEELQAFHSRAKALSEEISGRLRQELTESFNRDREDIRGWLAHQTENLQKMSQDAVLQADAEIKARNYISLETAKNSGDTLQREMIEQLQECAHRASEEFEVQISGRLSDLQSSFEVLLGHAVDTARVQAADNFKSTETELNRLAEESMTRCRSALAQNLKAIANTLDVQDGAKTPRS